MCLSLSLSVYIRVCVFVCMPNECDEFRMFYCSFAVRLFPISLVRFDVFLYDFFSAHARSLSPSLPLVQTYIYSHLPSIYVRTFFTLSNSKRYENFSLDVFFMYAHTTLYNTRHLIQISLGGYFHVFLYKCLFCRPQKPNGRSIFYTCVCGKRV